MKARYSLRLMAAPICLQIGGCATVVLESTEGDSSWQYTSPLRGPIQMSDKAELIAVVLAAEAIELQADAFPDGVEFVIDNQAVCFACGTLASGGKLRTSTAHYPTYRRLERVITKIGRPGFCRFSVGAQPHQGR
jgi:hypothetical protein